MTAAEEAASKEELVELIAKELDWPQATTRLRLHLERIRDDFNGVFGDRIDRRTGLSRFDESDVTPTETLTQQRDRFRDIEQACKEAAAAVGHALREVDWLPEKFHLRDPRSDVERQFEVPLTLNEYSAISWAYSEAAKRAADKLQAGLRSESTIAEEKATARSVWLLMGGPYIVEQVDKPHRTAVADYVTAHWAKLSPRFRKIYNRLQTRRRKPALPAPAVDQYVAPTPQKPPRFPRGKYLNVTALVYEYVTGEHREADSFETACREVREELEP
jgi:hypothetical protein